MGLEGAPGSLRVLPGNYYWFAPMMFAVSTDELEIDIGHMLSPGAERCVRSMERC